MRVKRLLIASLSLFVIALAWNALLHLVVLRGVNASVQHLRRTDLSSKWWLSLVLTGGLVALFTWGYGRFARSGSVREGVTYGVYFALVAGLLVDLNQHILYPIPARVAGLWFLGGLLEFSLYGALLTRLYPPTLRSSAAHPT